MTDPNLKLTASRSVKAHMRVTISRGTSFSDLKKVRAIVDAQAAADAIEILLRNSWTLSDIFVIEEVRAVPARSFRHLGISNKHLS